MNLDVFNLRQLQDIRTFLGLCKKEGIISEEVEAVLGEVIRKRTPTVSSGMPPRRELAKLCPKCNIQMRKEHKDIEAIWHCTKCKYSEYIGVVKGGYK